MCFPIRDREMCRCPPSSLGYTKDMVRGRNTFPSSFLPSLRRRGGMTGFVEHVYLCP